MNLALARPRAGTASAQADIQTTGLTLQAQYAYPKGVPTLTGYQATNTVTATLRNPKTAGTPSTTW